MSRGIYLVVTVAVLLVMSGCSSRTPHVFVSQNVVPKASKEKLLLKRFREYWNYRIEGKIDKAFLYELPYQQYLDGFNKYTKKVSPVYGADKIELLDYNISDDVAIVKRRVYVRDKNITKKDKWYFILDNWYHKYYQDALPPRDKEEAEFQ